MNVVPAKVAGVKRIVMVAPTPDGQWSRWCSRRRDVAGIDEIYRVGGAQAVAALAYGTKTIAPVAKIVGPGNAWVAAAKRRVFGQVGIDMIAGPSEVLILADETANPDWIAADLLAQAEHDECRAVHPHHRRRRRWPTRSCGRRRAASQDAFAQGDRRRLLARLWRDIVLVKKLSSTRLPLADRIAAEHLEIISEDAEDLAARVSQRRRHLHRRLYAGSRRRLCRRLQPCVADGAFGALLVGSERARLRQAHVDPEMRRGTRCAPSAPPP